MRASLLLSGLFVLACGGETNESQSPSEMAAARPGEGAAADPAAIEPARVDGVWTFFNQPDGWSNALFTGTAHIVDGCLRADDFVLVWMKSDEDVVRAFASSLGSSTVEVVLGGGSRSLEEERTASFGENLEELEELCPTSKIWFSGPLEDGWLRE